MGEMFGFDFISDQEMSRVSLTSKEIATTGLRDGDLLFGRRSVVPAGAGKCSLVVASIEPLTFESSIIRVRLDHSIASPLFYYHLFASSTGKALMSIIVSGTNVKGIRGSELRELKIPHPPLPEQRAIAAALNDVDALINSLDQLIAKKRNLKQAAMQQLLTGNRRLPGFCQKPGQKKTEVGMIPKDWEVKTLGSILNQCRLGGNYPNQDIETSYPLMKMGNIGRGTIDISKIEYISPGNIPDQKDRLRLGDLLFNTRNTLDLVGKVAIWRNELPIAYYNSNIMRLEFKSDEIASDFFANYVFNSNGFLSQLRAIATGTTSVAAIYTRDLLQLPFPVPLQSEQTAIATVLSDMDSEIATLEKQRDKTKSLKQGVMQELLTGRTRLI